MVAVPRVHRLYRICCFVKLAIVKRSSGTPLLPCPRSECSPSSPVADTRPPDQGYEKDGTRRVEGRSVHLIGINLDPLVHDGG